MNEQKISLKEEGFFTVLLVISAIFFFQEYLYLIDPNHRPFLILGFIPLTIVGIIGLGIFMVWYVLRKVLT